MIEEIKTYTKCHIPQDYIDFIFECKSGIIEKDGYEFDFYHLEEIIYYFKDECRGGILGSDDMLPIGDDMGSYTIFY